MVLPKGFFRKVGTVLKKSWGKFGTVLKMITGRFSDHFLKKRLTR